MLKTCAFFFLFFLNLYLCHGIHIAIAYFLDRRLDFEHGFFLVFLLNWLGFLSVLNVSAKSMQMRVFLAESRRAHS